MSKGYLTIAQIKGDPAELLEGYGRSAETMAEVGREHGLILHAAAKADHGLVIVNLWPSRAESESAARDQRRLAVIADHGLDPSRMSREHYEVVNWHPGPSLRDTAAVRT
jgi:hypothetical protein